MPYQTKARRSAYATYALLGLGGSLLALAPVASLQDYGPTWALVLWHCLLILGSVLAMFGVRTRRMTFQMVGATLAGINLFTYAVVVIAAGLNAADLTRLGFGVLFLGLPTAMLTLALDALEVEWLQDEITRRAAER